MGIEHAAMWEPCVTSQAVCPLPTSQGQMAEGIVRLYHTSDGKRSRRTQTVIREILQEREDVAESHISSIHTCSI